MEGTITAKQKLVQKRLTLPQLAGVLGNVSKAYRLHKISRSQFYEYKRAFQEFGMSGLIERPPISAFHPNELSADVTTLSVNCTPIKDRKQLLIFSITGYYLFIRSMV